MPENVGAILREKGSQIWWVAPDATVYEAIAMMADKSVGALLVLSGDSLVGIISERDYARRVILQGRSSKETRVEEVMTAPVQWVTPRQTVADCMKIMTASRVGHLPVLEGGKVVGIVSLGDLVRRLLEVQGQTIRHLQERITGKRLPL